MFEILRALIALQEACREHGTDLGWDIKATPGGGPVLYAEIALTDDDQQYVENMRALLAPAD